MRELADAPLILAAYGEPNGIVETGLAVGAADVARPAAAGRDAAVRDPQGRDGRRAGPAHGKVVTVFSPKGGSGKTVLATNLAVAAARSGMRTLLVDLDLQFGDSALTLAVTPRATIADLAASAGDIDADEAAAFVSTDPRTRARRAAGAAAARGGRRGRPGGARGGARRSAQRVRGSRHRHRARSSTARCSPRSTTPTSSCSSATPR